MKKNKLESGYAMSGGIGVYHFEHIDMEEANTLAELAKDSFWVVETINWTYAEGDKERCHHNKYLALDLGDAIAMAARLQINALEVAENVVDIRLATEEESSKAMEVMEYFDNLMPNALPDDFE